MPRARLLVDRLTRRITAVWWKNSLVAARQGNSNAKGSDWTPLRGGRFRYCAQAEYHRSHPLGRKGDREVILPAQAGLSPARAEDSLAAQRDSYTSGLVVTSVAHVAQSRSARRPARAG